MEVITTKLVDLNNLAKNNPKYALTLRYFIELKYILFDPREGSCIKMNICIFWNIVHIFSAGLVTSYLIWRKNRWIKVGQVDELIVYPLKGGQGVTVDELDCRDLCARAGDIIDRGFILSTPQVNNLSERN